MKTIIEEEVILFYGSELFSLANLMEDYNSRKAGDGYAEIEISVELNAEPPDTNEVFTADEYSDISLLLDAKNEMESRLEHYERNNSDYNNKSVKYYAGRTNREIARDFKDELEDNGYVINGSTPSYEVDNILRSFSETSSLMTEIDEYKLLDAEYVEFQKKYFYCESIEYNDQNSRIEKMVIHEV